MISYKAPNNFKGTLGGLRFCTVPQKRVLSWPRDIKPSRLWADVSRKTKILAQQPTEASKDEADTAAKHSRPILTGSEGNLHDQKQAAEITDAMSETARSGPAYEPLSSASSSSDNSNVPGQQTYEMSSRNGNGSSPIGNEESTGETSVATAVAQPKENGAALDLVKKAETPDKKNQPDEKPDLGTLWGLLVLGLAYVHHSTSGFALPALLPLITPDLQLTDTQGSMLTSGYTVPLPILPCIALYPVATIPLKESGRARVLYALALIPVGLLADKADRPRLLSGGLVIWSVLTMVASKVNGFGELLATRIVFACAQATQNPICFSLIPELFRKDRTTAMAAYNSAIYMGRALSFAAVIVAGKLGMAKATGDIGVTMVPLNSLDLSHVSILYTQGEMAAITPIYDYNFSILHGTVTVSSWRQLLFWLGPPGIAIGALALLTLDEPRKPVGNILGDVFSSSKFTSSATRDLSRSQKDSFEAAKERPKKKSAEKEQEEKDSFWNSCKDLVGSPVFQAVTLAAAFNDVGSWALVGWQATFYQRVYDLGPDVYAPALAGILPIGGIIGGVGGGLMGDWLSRKGGLQILTSGATIAACPVLCWNILAPDATQSFAALLLGFALSEMWRAPAAIMIRDVSPPNLGSTGSAVHLCVRNLMGGMGPLSIAWLSNRIGLQKAMLLVPACYFLSGVGFFFAHRIQDAEKQKQLPSSASNS